MHNFKVIVNDGQYKVCDHPFKLLFMGGTVVIENDMPDIPLNAFNFKDFGEILTENCRRDLLVDIIGALEKVTYQGLHNKPKKVVFFIKDLSGQLLNCTLWEDHAVKFMDYYNECANSESIILILTQGKIKERQGAFPISISNSFYGSKLILDQQNPEIQSFKKSFVDAHSADVSIDTQHCTQLAGSSQLSASSQYSDQEKFLYKADVKTLSEINAIEKVESYELLNFKYCLCIGYFNHLKSSD